MRDSLGYRLSLGVTILLTLATIVTLISSIVVLATGWGKLPFLELLPWKPLVFTAMVALNCIIRKRVILQGA